MNCLLIAMALVSVKCVQSITEEDNSVKMMNNGHSQAIDHLSREIDREPNSAQLYCQRSAAYHSFGHIEEALKDSEQCIKLDDKSVNGYVRKGYALVALNRLSEAEELFLKAHRIDMNDQNVMKNYIAIRLLNRKLSSNPSRAMRILSDKYSALRSSVSRILQKTRSLVRLMALRPKIIIIRKRKPRHINYDQDYFEA